MSILSRVMDAVPTLRSYATGAIALEADDGASVITWYGDAWDREVQDAHYRHTEDEAVATLVRRCRHALIRHERRRAVLAAKPGDKISYHGHSYTVAAQGPTDYLLRDEILVVTDAGVRIPLNIEGCSVERTSTT